MLPTRPADLLRAAGLNIKCTAIKHTTIVIYTIRLVHHYQAVKKYHQSSAQNKRDQRAHDAPRLQAPGIHNLPCECVGRHSTGPVARIELLLHRCQDLDKRRKRQTVRAAGKVLAKNNGTVDVNGNDNGHGNGNSNGNGVFGENLAGLGFL